jgi:hypothetical protein
MEEEGRTYSNDRKESGQFVKKSPLIFNGESCRLRVVPRHRLGTQPPSLVITFAALMLQDTDHSMS